MQIEVWADVICPWCGLGDHRLRRALERVEGGAAIQVAHRSFQLDRSAPEGVSRPSSEMLAERGYDPAQLAASQHQIEALAAAEGLTPYRVGGSMVGSTALVHELLAHASAIGDGHQAWQRTYQAYFGAGHDIFTVAGLVELAPQLGIAAGEAQAVLTDRRHRAQVAADQEAATRLGVRGVPFFVIDGRYAVSGAQPTDALVEAIQAAHTDNA